MFTIDHVILTDNSFVS